MAVKDKDRVSQDIKGGRSNGTLSGGGNKTSGSDRVSQDIKGGNRVSQDIKGGSTYASSGGNRGGGSSGGGDRVSQDIRNGPGYIKSEADRTALSAAGKKWNEANARGDKAGMDSAHAEAEAIRNKYGFSGGDDGSAYIKLDKEGPVYTQSYQTALDALLAANKKAPTYNATYEGQLKELYDQIVGREKFKYDINTDMLYQQYRQQYQDLGRLSMQDTMGQAAGMTGGYGSSYSQAVGQQQYDAYLQRLNDIVPDLYAQAYQRYSDEGDALLKQYGLLGSLADREYEQYSDAYNRWFNETNAMLGQYNNDRDFAYNQYRDQVNDSHWDQNFKYQAGRDQVNDQRYNTEWQYQVDRDKLDDQRYDSKTAYDRAMAMLSAGVMPGSDLLDKAGITGTQASIIAAGAKKAKTSKSGGKKKSGTSSGTQDYEGLFAATWKSKYPKSFIANNHKKYGFDSQTGLYDAYLEWNANGVKPYHTTETQSNEILNQNGSTWVHIPGLGRITYSELEGYLQSGKVKENTDSRTGKAVYRLVKN